MGRATVTALAVQSVLPELLDKPVGTVKDADIFAFRAGMLREGNPVRETIAGKHVERRGPYTRVAISQVFRKAARGAGLKDFRFHDLRHHGATMALNQRVHRADRDGARRLEDGADDAAVCGGDGRDAARGRRGRQWTRIWECGVGMGR